MTRVVYLSGGVGGARLAEGLAEVLAPEELTLVVNTGDDFQHWGLQICPDLDTVMYTLSGLAEVERGWGLRDETFNALDMVRRYGGADWFQLGDRDLATHLLRSAELQEGARLTDVTGRLSASLGVRHQILPMADEPRATTIECADGRVLSFQSWLVGERGKPEVRAVHFGGSRMPTPEVCTALERADLVLIGPSNPYVSIDPLLSLEGIRERVQARPCLAVSPLIGGKAVKGPLAQMIPALAGRPAGSAAIQDHYSDLLNAIVVHPGDGSGQSKATIQCFETDILMPERASRVRLAKDVMSFARQLA